MDNMIVKQKEKYFIKVESEQRPFNIKRIISGFLYCRRHHMYSGVDNKKHCKILRASSLATIGVVGQQNLKWYFLVLVFEVLMVAIMVYVW